MATDVAVRLFDLLREEASEASFRQLAAELDMGADVVSTPDQISRVLELALGVRRQLAECRRRTAELVALYETAHDLTALRDLEKVLEAIVERSQRLLSTDVAYLMLIDEERGDTYMRSTKGTVTPGFPDIRLPLGLGLGGLVAQTGTPYATADYTRDPRFIHVIDDIVIEERLTAILGVPLMIGRRVIGVLFAADRHPRHFEPQEISLLASLAANAAVAIENASLFQGARSAIERLTEANAQLQAQKVAIERAAELHDRLTKLVLRGTSVSELAFSVVEVLDGTLLVLDDRNRVLTRAGVSSEDGCVVPSCLPELVGEALGDGRSVQLATGSAACWVTPVVAAGNHLATLVYFGREVCDADLRTLERTAMVTALLLLNERAMDEANNRIRGELLAEALLPVLGDPNGLRRRAALIGVDLNAPHIVAAVAIPHHRRARLAAKAMFKAQSVHGLMCIRDDHLVMLIPGTDADAVSAGLAHRFGNDIGAAVTVGGAGPVTDPGDIAAAAQMARKCLAVLQALGRAGEGVSSHQLGAYGLLLNGVDGIDINEFIESVVGPVLAYDGERRTELLATLEAYFAEGGHAKRAAAALHLHVNTLYQRLDRLDDILGPDWRTGDKLLQVHLALKLRRLRSAGSFGP